jgi:hypothetical protein
LETVQAISEVSENPYVTFREDTCRAREKNAPENPVTIRKPALQIIFNVTDRFSLKKRQYKAALNIQYMKKLIKF